MICLEENCTCPHHRLLDCLAKGLNEEAKSFLEKLKNFSELADSSGLTLLHYCVKYGNTEMAQHLIEKGCKVNAQDTFGVAPLMLAVKANAVKTAKILIKNDADVFITDSDGTCSLQLAFWLNLDRPNFGFSEGTLNPMLEMFFNKVNNDFLKDPFTKQLLLNRNNMVKLVMVTFGIADIANFLLKEHRYPIDFQEPEYDCTALHMAIAFSRFENAKLLIEHRANMSILNRFNDSAIVKYLPRFESVDEDLQVLKSFIMYSTTLPISDGCQFLNMRSLVGSGKKKTIRAILQSVYVDAYYEKGRSLLPRLMTNKNEGIVDLFAELDIKPNVNVRDKGGYTPLMRATYDGCPRNVEFLLEHGADPNTRTTYGQPALTRWGHFFSMHQVVGEEANVAKIIELLLQYGADNAQSFFCGWSSLVDSFSLSTKVLVAHFATLAAVEQPSLTEASRDMIESRPQLNTYFDSCMQQLKRMKELKVHGAVTLFKLLTESEEKIVAYTRNQELMSTWSSIMENLSDSEPYYVSALQRRISRGLKETKLQEKVTSVIKALTGLCTDVVYMIICYLGRQDLHNLCEIDNFRPGNLIKHISKYSNFNFIPSTLENPYQFKKETSPWVQYYSLYTVLKLMSRLHFNLKISTTKNFPA